MVSRNCGMRTVWLLVVAAAVVLPLEAFASPAARRLARRGVVVPPPGPVPLTPAPTARPWRRRASPPGVARVPGAAGMAARVPAAATPSGPLGSPGQAQAATASPQKPASAVKQIPPPLPLASEKSVAAGRVPAEAETAAFTPAWFAKHPAAWQPEHLQADGWKVADVASLTTWLRYPVTRAAGVAADAGIVTTAGGDLRNTDGPDADGLQSVLVFPASNNEPVAHLNANSDWLPLGVFAVVPQGGSQAHNYQQLIVDRAGTIKGNSYDALSDTVQPVRGVIDRDTLKASWTVGANGSRFEAPIEAFATPPRTVTVSSGGTKRVWELMPVHTP